MQLGAEIRRICACECYYSILGVPKDADDAALKKAYRRSALKLHPDKCPLTGADEAFKKVSSAYACLSDSEKRRSYNTWGTEDRSKMGFNGFRGGGSGDVDAEELFRAFFGNAGMQNTRHGAGGMHFFNAADFFGPQTRAGCNRGGSGSGGGGGGAGGGGGPQFVEGGAGGVIGSLMRTFINNPWTLLTAFVALSSVVSLLQAVMARPYLLVLPFVIPAGYRMQCTMLLFALLCSGVLL